MRSGIPYPDERILIVRPCLVSLCIDVRPAAKLLSFLLYRYSIRQESKEDAENINELKKAQGQEPDQDTSYRIYRKQAQLVKDLAGECTAKTIHDVAVPCLQLLGYIDFEDSYDMPCYTLHIDRVLKGLEVYSKDLANKTHSHLEKFLKEIPQLENFLIVKSLEKFLIDKNYFQMQLKKFLIENRKSSNCQRGRKPRKEVALDSNFESPQIDRDIRDSKNESTPTVTSTEPEADSSIHPSTPSLSANENTLTSSESIPSESSQHLEQMSTPNVDNSVDKQSSSKKGVPQNEDTLEHPSDHIANPATQNQAEATPNSVESMTTRNTPSNKFLPDMQEASTQRNTEPLDPLRIYDEAEKQMHYWWLQLDLEVKVNTTNKGHWKTLSRHVHSFEDMKSLYEYTEREIERDPDKDKVVKPGNLANADNLNGWKKVRRRVSNPEPPQDKPKTLAEKNAEKMRYAGIIVGK